MQVLAKGSGTCMPLHWPAPPPPPHTPTDSRLALHGSSINQVSHPSHPAPCMHACRERMAGLKALAAQGAAHQPQGAEEAALLRALARAEGGGGSTGDVAVVDMSRTRLERVMASEYQVGMHVSIHLHRCACTVRCMAVGRDPRVAVASGGRQGAKGMRMRAGPCLIGWGLHGVCMPQHSLSR